MKIWNTVLAGYCCHCGCSVFNGPKSVLSDEVFKKSISQPDSPVKDQQMGSDYSIGFPCESGITVMFYKIYFYIVILYDTCERKSTIFCRITFTYSVLALAVMEIVTWFSYTFIKQSKLLCVISLIMLTNHDWFMKHWGGNPYFLVQRLHMLPYERVLGNSTSQ